MILLAKVTNKAGTALIINVANICLIEKATDDYKLTFTNNGTVTLTKAGYKDMLDKCQLIQRLSLFAETDLERPPLSHTIQGGREFPNE